MKAIQEDVHDQFKDWVRTRRGARLNAPEKKLFDGTIWTGRKAAELGLVDGIGDLRGVLREKFGEKVRLRPIKAPRNWLQKRIGVSRAGAVADDIIAAIEERLIWSRFGL
jgi:ClpP class serine protease